MGSRVEQLVTGLIDPLVSDLGLELVDVQYRKEGSRWYLRLFIDKENGVDIEDCRRVSDQAGKILDEEDPIPHGYLLEVSSPGVERPLKKAKDFQRFRGQTVKLRTFAPIEGQRNFRGNLEGMEGDDVVLALEQGVVRIPFAQIARANLVVDF